MCDSFGLVLEPQKCIRSTVRLTWLEFGLCSERMVITITSGKLSVVMEE